MDETTHPEAFRLVQRLMARIQEDGGVVHASSMVEEIVRSPGWRESVDTASRQRPGWVDPAWARLQRLVDGANAYATLMRDAREDAKRIAPPIPEATKRSLAEGRSKGGCISGVWVGDGVYHIGSETRE